MQSASPALKPPTLPLPGLAYDPVSKKLVLAGALAESGPDYWVWDSTGWHEPQTTGTSRSFYGSTMAYDAGKKTMVLVIPPGAGTWLWEETGWRKSNSMPALLAEPELAYDSKDGVVLALALSAAVAGPHPLPILPLETVTNYWGMSLWAWDGATWRASKTPLFRRTRPAMAYDDARGQLLVFGGPDAQDPQLPIDPTTFLWDGAGWKAITSAVHPPLDQPSAAYDPIRQEVVVYSAGETWAWNGTLWTERSSAGPAPRLDQRMAFDASIGQVVLFGGRTPDVRQGLSNLNDLWGWDGTRWTQLA